MPSLNDVPTTLRSLPHSRRLRRTLMAADTDIHNFNTAIASVSALDPDDPLVPDLIRLRDLFAYIARTALERHELSSDPLASLLRLARTRAGLTPDEMAARACTSPQAIWRYEHGRNRPRTRTLIRLFDACGTTLAEMLTVSLDPDPYAI